MFTCKKCGHEIRWDYCSGLVKSHIDYCHHFNKEVPDLLSTVYKNYKRFFLCEKCDEPIDYKDMPIDMFFNWLQHSSEAGDSREDSGKALIRYFGLDKLLQLKKEEGD